ncbi:MAG: DMT family transporter [Candidatus Brocadiaceae bacterium]|nr:DMT family transporter [Candidatus Brocadiaceae bacterium]
MRSSPRTAWAFGLVAAALWSPHFFMVESLRAGGVSALAIAFHLLLWPAAACAGLVFLGGGGSVRAVFNRRETQLLVLAALGGYGFWTLRMLALDAGAVSPVRVLFCSVPLMMALMSLLGNEKADARALRGLVLGFAGCLALIAAGTESLWAGPVQGKLWAFGSAVCWAVFAVTARPVVREERVLPIVSLVLGIGVLCVGVTCLSRGENPFQLRPAQLRTAAVAGLLTVGLMTGAWLKCLAGTPVAQAGVFWYVAPLFGIVAGWRHRPGLDLGWALAGTVLIILALRTVLRRRKRARLTMGDLIRSG